MSTLMSRKLNILMLHKNYLYNVAKDDFFNDSKTSNVICRKFWIKKHSVRHILHLDEHIISKHWLIITGTDGDENICLSCMNVINVQMLFQTVKSN